MELGTGIRQLSRGRENRISWAVRSTTDVGKGKEGCS